MGSEAKVGAVTPMCEEDAQWLPQYLAEVERLQMHFAVHFDRCSKEFRDRVKAHPLYIGCTLNVHGTYEERFREGPLRVLEKAKFGVAVFMDMDETFEPAFGSKLAKFVRHPWDCARIYWYNMWEDTETIRLDNPSNPHRMKLFRLGEANWTFKGITVDPYPDRKVCTGNTNMVSFNWGLMSQELREMHKRRWDTIYAKAVGKNPYGFWDYILAHEAVTGPKLSVCQEELECEYST